MTAPSLLPRQDARTQRDRLEVLTVLINGPEFDPVLRGGVLKIPPTHPVYPWSCTVPDCARPRWQRYAMCSVHAGQWQEAEASGMSRAQFLRGAEPLAASDVPEEMMCRICPQRPAFSLRLVLCFRHRNRWLGYLKRHPGASEEDGQFERWLADQQPCPGYGECRTEVCDELASSPLGLCGAHERGYIRAGRPGGARLPKNYFATFERQDRPVPISIDDQIAFRSWCRAQLPVHRTGRIYLRGLRPLLRAEFQWGMYAHRLQPTAVWNLTWVQSLADECQRRDVASLAGLDPSDFHRDYHQRMVQEMQEALRKVYFSPSDTRDAGYIETEHFGVRFPHRSSYIDLTCVSQRWLRDLLWDHIADVLRSPSCPRSAQPVDYQRRAGAELSAFLEAEAPDGGHDPRALREEHAHRFVADLRNRERLGLAFRGQARLNGKKSKVTENMRRLVLNYGRSVLRGALDNGSAERIGLNRAFITAMPVGGPGTPRSRNPFPDEVARALADESNLRQLAEDHDPHDRGLRDMWEAIIITGRRANEVIQLHLDCIGRYGGMPVLWHDQTKVGNLNAAIRIPDRLMDRLEERRRKTLARFADRHAGRAPTPAERVHLALFPTDMLNPDGHRALSYTWFHTGLRNWITDLDLGGHYVAHQARHTLATRLLRAGASLTHIRRYMGQVSDRMAEHYVHLTQSDLDDVLQRVWVAGPGTANPGELLAGIAAPLTREQAQALAIDLSRRSTPAEGGFCTFQPVVEGGACPWNLDCHNCDKFVLSGADLLYWRRKREQWRLLAEGAPDDATADYLHRYFEPTARAIDGLESALAGLGLLDDALALDLRKPQDYFHRVWSTAFRATDLAEPVGDEQAQAEDTTDEQEQCA
ncbi:site-specific integrase [Streptacidiphilus sp. PB12-B1b]|uniref:tyrosine-type recombinase/integrase n=1 Tax=Streptacidiphilus sp. PB12-B1b TaxID=2705012 RepID=UPI0015FBF8D5|nr:site-specific integrase [Streptacidiphilus sp. PB12-B1b]